MNYEELEYEAQHLTQTEDEYTYDKDTLEEIYQHPETLAEDDEISDWEEGFMQGYART